MPNPSIMSVSPVRVATCAEMKKGYDMLKILVADDEPVFLEKIKQMLTVYAEQMKFPVRIDGFTRDDISDFLLRAYDIAFLDIDFGQKRGAGIEIARRLRMERNDAVIIFVTNFVEYAPEGYELRAFRYLLKTDADEKLKPYFEEAVTQFTAKREYLTVQSGGDLIHLNVDDILYLESDKHTVYVHVRNCTNSPYSCYATLQSFEQKLAPLGFLRIHKSFLVNMRWLEKLQYCEALLKDGEFLRVSEKNYAAIKKQYLLWKGSSVWNT